MPVVVAASYLVVGPGGTAPAVVPVLGAAGLEGPVVEGPPSQVAAVGVMGGEEEGEGKEEGSVGEHGALE